MIPFLLSLTSLPLLLPTSLSSSLNLLLLNLTYTTIILSYPPLYIELFAVLLTSLFFFWLPTAALALTEAVFPEWRIKETRVKPAKRWKGREKQLLRGIGNLLLTLVLEGAIEWTRTELLAQKSFIRVSRTLPLVGSLIWDLARAYLIRSVLIYLIHRFLLHHKPTKNSSLSEILTPLTTSHRTHYHASSPPPSPLTPASDGPIPYLLLSFLPIYLPASILHLHILTYTLFLALTNLETCLTHSFLTLPSVVTQVMTPLLVAPWRVFGVKGRVERHLVGGGRGEFEGWGVCDWVGGTGRGKGEGWEEGVRTVREVGGVNVGGEEKKGKGRRRRG